MVGYVIQPQGQTAGPGLMGHRKGVAAIFSSDSMHPSKEYLVWIDLKAAWDSVGDVGLALGDPTHGSISVTQWVDSAKVP